MVNICLFGDPQEREYRVTWQGRAVLSLRNEEPIEVSFALIADGVREYAVYSVEPEEWYQFSMFDVIEELEPELDSERLEKAVS